MAEHAATYPVPEEAKNSGKVCAMFGGKVLFKADTLQEVRAWLAENMSCVVPAQFTCPLNTNNRKDAMDLR